MPVRIKWAKGHFEARFCLNSGKDDKKAVLLVPLLRALAQSQRFGGAVPETRRWCLNNSHRGCDGAGNPEIFGFADRARAAKFSKRRSASEVPEKQSADDCRPRKRRG